MIKRLRSPNRGLTAANAARAPCQVLLRTAAETSSDDARQRRRILRVGELLLASRMKQSRFAKIDAPTEDRAVLAGFAHGPLEAVAVAFGGRGGGIGMRQAQDRKGPSGRGLYWPPSWPCQRSMNASTASATHDSTIAPKALSRETWHLKQAIAGHCERNFSRRLRVALRSRRFGEFDDA
ncbi:hypothetical protein SAMN02927900_00421 [Rhizobium mongolense subsp. loessense]|uniref:Uncharacterized protein n=1 Tax=Rhizobium mongolense subsp. loessense TaxID=158890 RepID=A0A1G4PDZ8_9HYPH|nr:hypothetical protein SAMN02927900_00421 [Rhizobium mongolense subsp. loessense]